MFLPEKITETLPMSFPYLLVATQVYSPSSFNTVLAVSVVFTSTVEFFIRALYMGGVPVAKQDSL